MSRLRKAQAPGRMKATRAHQNLRTMTVLHGPRMDSSKTDGEFARTEILRISILPNQTPMNAHESQIVL